jgi:glycosyltransferase involved in cell wall biosynthesis
MKKLTYESDELSNELISIICPLYNAEEYLKYSINSICNQSYKNLEIILIDDGSSDSTVQKVLALKDSRIKLIKKINGGKNSALNLGMKQATGKFIYFFDQDDFIPEDYIETLHADIVTNQVDIAISTFIIDTIDIINKPLKVGKYVSLRIYYKESILLAHFRDNLLGVVLWNKLFRSKVLENFVFNEGYILDDLPSTYKLLSNANTVSLNSNLNYFHIRHNKSNLATITNFKSFNDESLLIYNRMIEFFEEGDYINDVRVAFRASVLMPISLGLSQIKNIESEAHYGKLLNFIWNNKLLTFRKLQMFRSLRRLFFVYSIYLAHKTGFNPMIKLINKMGTNYSKKLSLAYLRR